MTLLHPRGYPPRCLSRMPSLAASRRGVDLDALPRLDIATADHVCLAPEALIANSEWPRWRVGLARAGRFFIVEIDQPVTATIVGAMRDGAFDVLSSADTEDRWKSALAQVAESQRLWLSLYAGHADGTDGQLAGGSRTMAELRRDIERLGPTDVTVLILGESGAGKERIAAALHSAGRGGPFITVNCAAMPKDLLEAELFGAEKGAFTGAFRSRPGLFEQAAGGTLFLDEVGEMDLALQPKLLRILETRRARRVGGEKEYFVKLRVVAATNRELEIEAREGRFRPDLFYRLAEVVLRAPPLRARREDIPSLARLFIEGANERFGKHVEGAEPALLLKLQSYHWPGNVRELKSTLERLVLFHDGPVLREGWWDPPTIAAPISPAPAPAGNDAPRSAGSRLPDRSARVEMARHLVAAGQISLSEVAARTGVHPSTLFRWRQSGKV